MANLNETPTWEPGVYQLEEEDLVQGGPDGIDNTQAKQLGNRTQYLKQQIEAAVGEMTAHLAAADPHTQYATELWVAGQITALINAAPGALDTLNELAEAMGDDPNFAATVANALALKAPLASPVFTGNPTAPTPAQFDNDTSLATTAFLKRMGLESSGITVVAVNTVLTVAHAGGLVVGNSATPITITLPACNTFAAGSKIEFMNIGTGAMTVARAGADQIAVNNAGVTSVSLGNGDSLFTEANGLGTWHCTGGSAQLGFSGAFGSSIAANGWQKLPSGLIVQWGQFDASASVSGTTTFPIAFPNNLFSLTFGTGSAASTAAPYCTSSNTASFTWNRGSSGSVQGRYLATGV